MQIILASASPRRQELLKMIVSDFTVQPARMEEVVPEGMSVLDCPGYLATEKAKWVAAENPDALVIGSDTAVILGDTMLGKPADAEDARKMLQALSGNTHLVITGCCLIYQGKIRTFYEATKVEFYNLTAEEIDAYIATGEPFDKAGACGIQGKGGLLVKHINGDYYNVVGLPVARLRKELSAFIKG